MSNKKNLFSTLATITAGAIAGTALVMNPIAAVASEHDKEKHDCKCSGEKKAACEKEHGEHSCGGEGKCSGDKKAH